MVPAIVIFGVIICIFLARKNFSRSGRLERQEKLAYSYILEARKLIAQQSFGKAEQLLNKSLDISPSQEAHAALIETYRGKKLWLPAALQTERYIDQYEPLLAKNDVIGFKNAAGEAYLYAGHFKEALAIFSELLRIDKSKQTEYYKYAGKCLYELGEKTKAAEFFTFVHNRSGEDTDALLMLAVISYEQSRLESAENYLSRIFFLDKKNPGAHFHMGLIYFDQKNYEGAEKNMKSALRGDEYRLKAFSILSKIKFAMKLNGEGMEYLEKGLSEIQAENSLTLQMRYEAAAMYETAKQFQNALDQWRIIADASPGYRDVAEKIQTNARYGHDRLTDFKVLTKDPFNSLCRRIAEYFGYTVKRWGKISSDFSDAVSEEKSGGEYYLRFYRGDSVFNERQMEDFCLEIKRNGLSAGVVISTNGATPGAGKFIMDKDILVIGPRALMKALKYAEEGVRNR